MIRAFSHVGISVASLERSVAFYTHVLGFEVLQQVAFHGERYERILGLPGARGRIAVIKRADLELELFEFERPECGGADGQRPVSNLGISHFAVSVDDMAATYARLEAAGVQFHCPPIEFPGVATATYARDPDGNVIEFIGPLEVRA